MTNRAKVGDRVRVEYTRSSKPDTTEQPSRKTREFTVGSNEVIPGLSLGVVGMASGEKKKLTLPPGDAYGPVRPELIKKIPRRRFPSHLKLSVGKRLTAIGITSGRRRQVRVVEVNTKTVVVDRNHPLAGKTVEVEVQLVSLNAPA